jgi:hypothetical protein
VRDLRCHDPSRRRRAVQSSTSGPRAADAN